MNLTALAAYSLMSTHVPGVQSFLTFFLHHFVFAKLAISSIRVNVLLATTLAADRPLPGLTFSKF